MSYMVCHFGKYKSGNVFGLQKHNQRENENYSNIDIYKARTSLNYNLNHLKRVKMIIDVNRVSEMAIRKDATYLGGIFINKNNNLIYCILGSIILILFNTSIVYDSLRFLPIIGFFLSQLTYFISSIGVILTLYFTIMLIKEN